MKHLIVLLMLAMIFSVTPALAELSDLTKSLETESISTPLPGGENQPPRNTEAIPVKPGDIKIDGKVIKTDDKQLMKMACYSRMRFLRQVAIKYLIKNPDATTVTFKEALGSLYSKFPPECPSGKSKYTLKVTCAPLDKKEDQDWQKKILCDADGTNCVVIQCKDGICKPVELGGKRKGICLVTVCCPEHGCFSGITDVKDKDSKSQKVCDRNIKILTQAMEKYARDKKLTYTAGPAPEKPYTESLGDLKDKGNLEALIQGGYLKKAPVCPEKGSYKLSFIVNPDRSVKITVCCSRHSCQVQGTDQPTTPGTENPPTANPEPPAANPPVSNPPGNDGGWSNPGNDGGSNGGGIGGFFQAIGNFFKQLFSGIVNLFKGLFGR